MHFCGLLKAALLLCMQEMDMLHVAGNEVEIYFLTRFGPNRPAADMEEMENLILW